MNTVFHELRLFFIALQFLTRVPIPAWVGFDAVWLHASARHFPGVGVLVGGFIAALLWLGAHLWPALVAVLFAVAAGVWLTGAFHEDGLADTFDALGGSVSRERALEIMKDSRIGTYGAVALMLVMALKLAALHGLVLRDLATALLALPLVHAWSRLAPVLLLKTLPYAGDAAHAKAKPMAQQVGAAELNGALIWCALAAFVALVLGQRGVVLASVAASVVLVALLMGLWLRRRLGGYTGDTLGATQQLAETAAYLTLLAAQVHA